jgi:hypothetical protein
MITTDLYRYGLQARCILSNDVKVLMLKKTSVETNCKLDLHTQKDIMCTRATRRVPLLEQELLTIPKYSRSHPVFSGVGVARSLVFSVVFYRSLFVTFSLVIV